MQNMTNQGVSQNNLYAQKLNSVKYNLAEMNFKRGFKDFTGIIVFLVLTVLFSLSWHFYHIDSTYLFFCAMMDLSKSEYFKILSLTLINIMATLVFFNILYYYTEFTIKITIVFISIVFFSTICSIITQIRNTWSVISFFMLAFCIISIPFVFLLIHLIYKRRHIIAAVTKTSISLITKSFGSLLFPSLIYFVIFYVSLTFFTGIVTKSSSPQIHMHFIIPQIFYLIYFITFIGYIFDVYVSSTLLITLRNISQALVEEVPVASTASYFTFFSIGTCSLMSFFVTLIKIAKYLIKKEKNNIDEEKQDQNFGILIFRFIYSILLFLIYYFLDIVEDQLTMINSFIVIDIAAFGNNFSVGIENSFNYLYSSNISSPCLDQWTMSIVVIIFSICIFGLNWILRFYFELFKIIITSTVLDNPGIDIFDLKEFFKVSSFQNIEPENYFSVVLAFLPSISIVITVLSILSTAYDNVLYSSKVFARDMHNYDPIVIEKIERFNQENMNQC